MSDEIAITSKVFQGLFSDADYQLDQAEEFHAIVKDAESQKPQNEVQVALGKARAHSRACIIEVVAGLESLCNCAEDLLQERCTDDIPENWIPKKQRGKKFRDWHLVEKVRFVPVLCCGSLLAPDSYFQKSENALNELREIYRVRNSVVHAGMVTTRYTIEFGSNSLHTIRDDFPENFWKITHFPRDLRSLSYDEARHTYDHVLRLARQMVGYLGEKVTLAFLRDDELVHAGRRFPIQRESVVESVPRWCEILLGSE
jgi:hypothetical protein